MLVVHTFSGDFFAESYTFSGDFSAEFYTFSGDFSAKLWYLHEITKFCWC